MQQEAILSQLTKCYKACKDKELVSVIADDANNVRCQRRRRTQLTPKTQHLQTTCEAAECHQEIKEGATFCVH